MGDLFADGDLHFQLTRVLKSHWLFDLGCDGESNQAACSCGFPDFPRVGNVGEAVSTYVNHVLEEMREYIAAWGDQQNTRSLTPQAGEGVVEAVARAIAEHMLVDRVARYKPDKVRCENAARAAIAALPPAGRVEEDRIVAASEACAAKVVDWFNSPREGGDTLDLTDTIRTALNGSGQ